MRYTYVVLGIAFQAFAINNSVIAGTLWWEGEATTAHSPLHNPERGVRPEDLTPPLTWAIPLEDAPHLEERAPPIAGNLAMASSTASRAPSMHSAYVTITELG